MAEIGYCRVSTTDQKMDRQLDRVKLDTMFEEKAGAADAARPQLRACLEHAREGDTLHVHSIDRLARNLQDLLTLLQAFTGKGVAVRLHKEGLTFTGQDTPFQKLHFQIIGAVAEFERAIVKERQREGIAKAKAEGRHLGRERKLAPDMERVIRDRATSGADKSALAREYGISRQTLYRIIHRQPITPEPEVQATA
ncbi:recombinase family protein [Desulfovibrio aminophilus]|nr:recombinase family protein [Desulfovibrio aminophilus]MCM0755649.1 recombinase family protein [Desulfovibrio aminophilus]